MACCLSAKNITPSQQPHDTAPHLIRHDEPNNERQCVALLHFKAVELIKHSHFALPAEFPAMPVASRTFSSQEVPHSPFPVSCKYSTAVASTSQPPQPSSGYPPLSIGQWGGQPRDCAVQKAALALPGNEAGVHCTNSQFGHPPTLEEPQPAICSVLVMCMLLMVVIEIKVGLVSYHLTPLK